MTTHPIITTENIAPPSSRRQARLRIIRSVAWLAVGIAAGFMAWRLGTDPLVRQLSPRSFDVPSLILAGLVCLVSQLLYCSRWYWFLRVVHAPFTWAESVFTGLISQLLGAIAIGSAGGDVYRGVVAGRDKTGHHVGIVASILADRVVGLYSLFCVAALAATFTPGDDRWQAVRAASMPVLWTAVVAGGAGILAGLFVNLGPTLAWTRRIPPLFQLIMPLLAAVDRFRSTPGIFALAVVSGMVVHIGSAASLWLMAYGLGVPHPTLAEHCLITPLAMCTGLLPLPLAGLGAMELVIDQLYQATASTTAGAGLIAAFGNRLLGLTVTSLMSSIFMPLARAARNGRAAASELHS
jgi:glycosyltransferase 2 family protein